MCIPAGSPQTLFLELASAREQDLPKTHKAVKMIQIFQQNIPNRSPKQKFLNFGTLLFFSSLFAIFCRILELWQPIFNKKIKSGEVRFPPGQFWNAILTSLFTTNLDCCLKNDSQKLVPKQDRFLSTSFDIFWTHKVLKKKFPPVREHHFQKKRRSPKK